MKRVFKQILCKLLMLVVAITLSLGGLAVIAGPVQAAAADGYKRLHTLKAGDKVTLGGYRWIVLNPITGYLLMDEVYGQGPFSPVTGGLDIININEQYNVGSLLNNAAVTVNDKGELAAYGHGFGDLPGFLASMANNNSDYLKLILQHVWATGAQGHEDKPSPIASLTSIFKVALLSYDEFNAFKDIPGVVLPGQAWWLRTGTIDDDETVWSVNNSSLERKIFKDKMGIRPAMYVNTNTFCATTDTAGQYDAVLPQPDAIAMPTTPSFAPGTHVGFTSVTAKATLAGGKLAVQLSHHAITPPQNAFQITDISAESDSKGIVYPYTVGSEFGFAKAGDYVGVYDLDNKGHVYAFTQHQLTNDEIKQATVGLREPLKYLEPGSIIHFAGKEWVLLDPDTGYVLMKGEYSKEPVSGYRPGIKGLKGYEEDGAFYKYLNALDYNASRYSSIGFYQYLNDNYPQNISLIQDHEWTQTVYEYFSLDRVSDTVTMKSKIGLLSCQEFYKYKSLIPSIGNFYWMIDYNVDLTVIGNYHWMANDSGIGYTDAESKKVIVRPALYLNPTVEVYAGNNNVVRAVADLNTAPTAVPGILETTTVTAVPNVSSNKLKYQWSATDIIPPEIYTSAPAGLLEYSENIPAKPGDYIGVYEIDTDNKVVAYGELQLTADMCSPVAPQITPNGGTYTPAQTVSLSFNPGAAGDTAYYTTDGSDPYTSATKIKYTAPFTVDRSMTVRAQVFNSGLGGWSRLTSADFIRHSTINLTTVTFDKNSHKDLAVELALNGNQLTGIRKGLAVLTPGMHYTLSGNMVTISADYLSGFDIGSFNFTFEFSKGNSSVLSITIISSDIQDSAVSEVNTIFDQNPDGNLYVDLPVTLQLNGNTLVDVKNGSNTLVRGTDYVVTDESTVILKKTYLSTITPSKNTATLTFVFDKGANTNTANLKIKLINSSLAAVTIKAKDSQGNLYADGTGHMLFFIPAADGEHWGISMKGGTVYSLAGNATGGYAGDEGPVTGAAFLNPRDISIDHNGNIYIRDFGNRVIREIAAADGEQWGISMVAGNIYTVTPDKNTDIYGMWVDQDGDIIYSLTAGEYRIKMQAAVSGTKYGITMEAGNTYTIAGTGVYAGIIPDGGVALETPIDAPSILTTDKAGNIYFVKEGFIHMLPVSDGTYFNRAMTAGHVYLVAGKGTHGNSGDGQNARQALFGIVAGIAVDENGNLFIADKDYNVIREVAGTTMTRNGVSVTAGNIYTVAVADSFDCSQGVYANKTGGIWIPDLTLGKFGVREISAPTPTVPAASVNKKELNQALSQAVNKIKSIMIGTAVGNVSQEAKDTFQSAIDAATAVKTNASATQAAVDEQTTALYSAMDVFYDAIIMEKYLTGIPAPVGITGLANGVPKTKAGLTLPDTVIVETDLGNVQADVTWDVNSSSYDPDNTAEQTFTVTGTVTLPGNVLNLESIPLEVSISVTVNDASAATLESIAITTPASKLTYTVGDSLDISGMVVTGTYRDNSSKTEAITTAEITGFDRRAPAVDQVLTVMVGGKPTTYTVTIKAVPAPTLESIAITTPATKLIYTVGDSLDISSMVVTGTYSDNSSKTEAITTADITGFDSSAPAVDQVLTVTVGGKTGTYTVTIKAVPAPTLESIAITTPATKLIYTVGDSLDISGMVVTGTYSDSSTKTESFTASDITGFDSSAPAVDQVLTVTVGGKTTTYTVTIKAVPAPTLESIAITTPATKLIYTVGDSLDISSMVVTGTYSDNSSKLEAITTANITGFDSSAPAVDQVLTVMVGGKTTTYTVTINAVPAPTLESIAITTPATKLTYTVGDSLDISGMVVAGTYSDNSSKLEAITTANITGFDSGAPSVDQVLTVKVGGKTATYTVTINAVPAPPLESIAITTPASKLTYMVGDSLDISGMVVTGTYSDSSTKTEAITTANITGFDSSVPTVDQVLTVMVGGKTTTYTVTITVTTYQVTINGSYAAASGAGSYSSGDVVIINAGSRSNYTFNGWTSADGITFSSANSTMTTFTMPAKTVTVIASWSYNSSTGDSSSGSSNITDTQTEITLGGTPTTVDGNSEYTATITADQVNNKSVSRAVVTIGETTVSLPASVLIDALRSGTGLTLTQSAPPASALASAQDAAEMTSSIALTVINISLSRTVTEGTEEIHNLSGKVTVTIALTKEQAAAIAAGNQAYIYYYDPETGSLTDMEAVFDLTAKTATFSTMHFSIYVLTASGLTKPSASGVIDQGIYGDDRTITFEEATAALDGEAIKSGHTVSSEGSHILVLTDQYGITASIEFVIDKSAPVIKVVNSKKASVKNKGISNSNVTVTISDLSEVTKTVTRNGKAYAWPSQNTFTKEGKYVITVKDELGSSINSVFTIDKTVPVITMKASKKGKTVSIQETNLSSKTVTLNGKKIAWPKNNTFTKAGSYVVTVTDQAKHKTQYQFKI